MKQIGLIFIAMFLGFSTMDAQIIDFDQLWRKAKTKAKRKVNREASAAMDKGIESVDKVIHKKEGKEEKYSEDDMMSDPDVYEETSSKKIRASPVQYQFSGIAAVHVTKGAESQRYELYFMGDQVAVKYPKLDGKDKRVLLNRKEGTTTLLVSNQENKQAVKSWWLNPQGKTVKWDKTDEVKILEDKICRKYTLVDEAGTIEAWVSPEVNNRYLPLLWGKALEGFPKAILSLEAFPLSLEMKHKNGSVYQIRLEQLAETAASELAPVFHIDDFEMMDTTPYQAKPE